MDIWTEPRARLKERVKHASAKVEKREPLTDDEEYLLMNIEHAVEEIVIGAIHERQQAILDAGSTRLQLRAHGYKVLWGDEYTPGCAACLDGSRTASLRSVSRCNLNCPFCYYYGHAQADMPGYLYRVNDGDFFTLDDMRVLLDKQGGEMRGIAWVYWEPFMDFDKHPPLVKYIADKGIHQWMYTNGTLCTEAQLKELADAGLTELRFNLAATHCSRKVIKNMHVARKYFEYLCVESPMYREFYESFLRRKDEVLATGFDHWNAAELHVEGYNCANFQDEVKYRYHGEYVSPVMSRQYTYDLIELAEREDWTGITINDCSNQAKFYRGIYGPDSGDPLGANCWFGVRRTHLVREWYLDALDRYEIGHAP